MRGCTDARKQQGNKAGRRQGGTARMRECGMRDTRMHNAQMRECADAGIHEATINDQ